MSKAFKRSVNTVVNFWANNLQNTDELTEFQIDKFKLALTELIHGIKDCPNRDSSIIVTYCSQDECSRELTSALNWSKIDFKHLPKMTTIEIQGDSNVDITHNLPGIMDSCKISGVLKL